ncbi:disease resistance protein L6-like [Macadamia integrifolia]|uniref:disease resistance protein L6-like n=1 Tax=Macadamia integrifolia TaxID=60698 RepID=UPI001C4ECFB3|nr:disease resistance protein L6-like [Macadamia integrifolia]
MAAYDGASSSSGLFAYDVFLNFRGEETRNNFTGFLHKALKREGINVFMDNEELGGGEEIRSALLEAIQGSKISITIFSKGYADSKWCLLELVEIVRCHKFDGQIILPIFLDVEPTDVRHQTESFEGPFQKHNEKHDAQTIEGWKKSLTVVGQLKGYELKQVNGNQSELVGLVVDWALSKLSSNSLGDIKNPVGLDTRVEDLLSLLNVGSNDVQFVGICGIGGIGKTTIAKALYNRIFKCFHKSCFLANVREEAVEPNGLVSLQEKLIYNVSKNKVDCKICNVYRGQQLIKERLQGERVLLILDDVDCHSQLNALTIDFNLFGLGTRIVITSRDELLLKVAKVDEDKIYWPKELDNKQSLQLFSLHAFARDKPAEDYKQLSHDVLHFAGGLPLTLEVLGSYLFDIREKEVWQCTLEKLEKNPNKEVYEKLKISYDNLEDDEQSMFLDAACFFVGWRKEAVILIWKACGFDPISAIKKLTQRSLLKFTNRGGSNSDINDSYDELRMHDQIQAMGRAIVFKENRMEPSKRSRLWSRDDIMEVLEEHKGSQMIEGILLASNRLFPTVPKVEISESSTMLLSI